MLKKEEEDKRFLTNSNWSNKIKVKLTVVGISEIMSKYSGKSTGKLFLPTGGRCKDAKAETGSEPYYWTQSQSLILGSIPILEYWAQSQSLTLSSIPILLHLVIALHLCRSRRKKPPWSIDFREMLFQNWMNKWDLVACNEFIWLDSDQLDIDKTR